MSDNERLIRERIARLTELLQQLVDNEAASVQVLLDDHYEYLVERLTPKPKPD